MPRPRHINRGGTRGSVFKQVARIRLEDAAALLGAHRYSGAIYLGGYAVECLLKWAATHRLGEVYLSADLETHDWDMLLSKTGLQERLKVDRRVQALYSELADIWGPELRYRAKEPAADKAEILYNKLNQLYRWIEENTL